jgi:hypothetical protein
VELSLSSEDATFRDEVRAFIADNYPQEKLRQKTQDVVAGQTKAHLRSGAITGGL